MDDGSSIGSQRLRPAARDHVGIDLLRDLRHDLFPIADPHLEPDAIDPDRAVALEELLRPRLGIVLRFICERRLRGFVEDVKHDDVEITLARQLDDAARRERS